MKISPATFFVSIIFLTSIALAQGQELNPGQVGFEVRPVILSDVPLEPGDYCGNPARPQTTNQQLGLSSDPQFLNIKWNARDPGGLERTIGTNCWLNCPASSDEVLAITNPNGQHVCSGYQTCAFLGPAGELGGCSIAQPVFNFDSENSVVCRFYDIALPSEGLVAPNRSFYTVDFETSTPPVTLTVGIPTTLPITVKSFGILENFFTNNITALSQSFLVSVSNPVGNTENAFCGEVVQTFPTLFFLTAERITFSILTHSSVDTTTCSSNSDCAYLGPQAQCVNNACWGRNDVAINAGAASLPEYNVYGFIAILLAAPAIFFFARRKL